MIILGKLVSVHNVTIKFCLKRYKKFIIISYQFDIDIDFVFLDWWKSVEKNNYKIDFEDDF